MRKNDVLKFVKTIQNVITKHSPEILTGLGIVGMVTTTVLAVKATPKAYELIEAERERKKKELTKTEVVKVAWKPYIPAMISGGVAIACLIGASNVNARRNAALVSAYQLSTAALSEYKEKVLETVGEEKAKEVHDKIVEEKQETITNNATGNTTYIITNDDDIIFYEPISNREFKSSINFIEKMVNEANRTMIYGMEMYMSFNEFLDKLNLPHSPIGDDMGWTASECIDITFSDGHTHNNKPCFVINYLTPPFRDYQDRY